MVLIPAGEFLMGSSDCNSSIDKQPEHTVYTDAFYMDEHPVTNAEYKKFVEENPEWRKPSILSRAFRQDWWRLPKDMHKILNEELTDLFRNRFSWLAFAYLLIERHEDILSSFEPFFENLEKDDWSDIPENVNELLGHYCSHLKYHRPPDYLFDWKKNNYPPHQDNWPVRSVPWGAAMAYAEWVGKRLPTEAEWEKAAKGGNAHAKDLWWNDSIEIHAVVYFGALMEWQKGAAENPLQNASTEEIETISKWLIEFENLKGASVKKGTPNPYGLYDMLSGFGGEWCLDEYYEDFYEKSPRQNPIAGEVSSIPDLIENFRNVNVLGLRAVRGIFGFNDSDGINVRIANRHFAFPLELHGFRCVKPVKP